MKGRITLSTVWLIIALTSSLSTAGESSDKLLIYTVNYPLKYLAERIGGEHAEVVFPVPADVDPAYWMPDRERVGDFQKADLILLNGAHYAGWIEKVSLPDSKMVNTSEKIIHQYIKQGRAVTHSHGPGGEHAHEDAAFTIWLDFNILVHQATAIEKVMSRKRPELKSMFRRNYHALTNDFMDLDSELANIVSKNPSKPLISSHPVYHYLSRRYSMNVRSVHWEPGEPPSNAQWLEITNILRDHTAQWMIWKEKPLEETITKLKTIGIKSIVFDPCGNTPDEGDFLAVMKQNVKNLKAVFE